MVSIIHYFYLYDFIFMELFPYSESFAILIASSAFSAIIVGATGPKISSRRLAKRTFELSAV